MITRKSYQSLILAMTVFSLATMSGCGFFGKSTRRNLNASVENYTGSIGVRNVNQMAASMSKVTGVPLTQNVPGSAVSLRAQGLTIAPWMSPDGFVGTVNSSMLLATTGLAGSFCRALLQNESAAGATPKIHQDVNFALGTAGLTAPVQQALIKKYARAFWRRAPTAAELLVLTEAIRGSIADYGPVTTPGEAAQRAAAAAVLMVPCTATLSSLDFLKA